MPDVLRPGARWADSAYAISAYHYNVPHAYHLGGFQILPSIGIQFDEFGLDWVRTFVLSSKAANVGYRMVHPEDLPDLLGHGFPSDEKIIEMYGKPINENVPLRFRKQVGRT